MYQDIRNNIGKKILGKKKGSMVRVHLEVVIFFCNRLSTAERIYSFSLHSRIKFHVTLCNNPEQFLNWNHFTVWLLVLFVWSVVMEMTKMSKHCFVWSHRGRRVSGGELWKRFRGKLKTIWTLYLKIKTHFLLGCTLIFKPLLPRGHLILQCLKGPWSLFSVVYHTFMNLDKSMTPFLACILGTIQQFWLSWPAKYK